MIYSETGIWVSYGCGVYDITSFVPKHPGKTKIMFAAGKPIDAVWEHAKVHKTPHIQQYLETFRIGNLVDEATETKTVDIKNCHKTIRKDLPTYHADEVAKHDSE
jgi:sulfite oxidase